jgi:hypothetical protein
MNAEPKCDLALMHDSPNCGAKAGRRYGWWQEPINNPGYPQRRVWKYTPKLLDHERIPLCAWLVEGMKGWQRCGQLAPFLSKLDEPPLPMCEKHAEGVYQYGLSHDLLGFTGD